MLKKILLTVVAGLALAAVRPLRGDYPIVSHRFLADPAAFVHGGRVYVYCSNDDENAVGGGYEMKSIVCVSSSDLKNWTDHGVVFRVPANAAWAVHSWAPAVIERNGTFYLYFSNNASGIGVATSSSPTGPFTDARGSVLINAATPGVLPATNMWIFDPSVFIDGDGQAYLYFGGNGESNPRIIRLNEDMISTSGAAIGLTVPGFFEAAWMHQRDGLYYLSYSTNPANGLRIDYLTSASPTGPFTYRGIVAGQPPSNNNNNHAAQFELNGEWYHVFHNRIVAMQAGIPAVYRRNIAVERLQYNLDGSIQPVTYTTDGVPQVGHVNPYLRVEGEMLNAQSGIETEPCSAGGMNLTALEPGDWVRIRGVDFGSLGATDFTASVASMTGGVVIELRLGSPTGTLAGTCAVSATGGAQTWATTTCPVQGATGEQDLYLVFAGTGAGVFQLDWWQFTAAEEPAISSQPRSLTLNPGGFVSLWVEASGSGPLLYQWFKDGDPIPGATGRFFAVDAVTAQEAGGYSVEVTNAFGTTTSSAATIALATGATARLVNMSVRAPLAEGAVLIPGFVLGGTETRQLLLRAVGPGLVPFNVAGVLADPTMTLYAEQTALFTNNDWGAAPNAAQVASVGAALNAFPLDDGSRDAAVLIDLMPGLFTTHVTGHEGASGIVLFEVYEGEGGDSRFVNISARADIGTGDNVMIPGFSLVGTGARTLLIRAVGPSLQPHGVSGWLPDPTLTVYQGQFPILTNDNWGDAPDAAALVAAAAAVQAFALAPDSTDAAVLVSLMPGTYTAVAGGVEGNDRNVLVEVYDVP